MGGAARCADAPFDYRAELKASLANKSSFHQAPRAARGEISDFGFYITQSIRAEGFGYHGRLFLNRSHESRRNLLSPGPRAGAPDSFT
jgi:hypothetical protein